MVKKTFSFKKFIKKRSLEDYHSIIDIENILLKKRKYIFKMPPKNSPVILLLSGGIDSIIAWHYLLSKYKLDVYPLFLTRGKERKKKEEASVKYFTKFFKKEFGNKIHKPRKYSIHTPPPELETALKKPHKFFHPLLLLKYLQKDSNTSVINLLSASPYIFPLYGVTFARELEMSKNIKIRHIFNAVATGDGTIVPSQTYTALRSTMLSMCIMTADWSWNFTSIAMEKEINNFLSKADLIKYAEKNNIPLEKTWSCYNALPLQCGDNCLTCKSRKLEFNIANVKDKTSYMSDLLWYKTYRRVKKKIVNIFYR